MIFDSLEQILTYIKEPQNKFIGKAVKMYTDLNLIVNGVGVDTYLEQIQGYENKSQHELRRKLAMSTKHIMSSTLRSMDKVFTSRGGSMSYNLPDSRKPQMKAIVESVDNGIGIRNWGRLSWKNKFITDPNGIILWEVGEEEIYPTYKSIKSIHDYIITGMQPEYIIFKPYQVDDDDGEYYRVIDDALDRLVVVNGDDIREVEDETYPNYIGFVPAFTCSDIPDPNSDLKISPIDSVVELVKEYLRDMSIHTIYKFLHGYPVFWRYVHDCPKCDGLGKIDGNECPYCDGTGKKLSKDVSDVLGLAVPESGEPSLAPPAGYIQPDNVTWEQQRNELDWLYASIYYAIWGSFSLDKLTDKTATEIMADTQPIIDRLNEFTDTADMVIRKSIEIIGTFHFEGWGGASVSLGRRFQIESPGALLKEYTGGVKNGLSDEALNYMLIQYYHAEFEGQPLMLARMLKLMQVEPFIHIPIEKLKDMNVPEQDYKAKLYYAEWSAGLGNEKVLFVEPSALREQLYIYVSQKELKDESKKGTQNQGV